VTNEKAPRETASSQAPLPCPRSARPIILWGVLILLCGVAIGWGGAMLWLRDRMLPRRSRLGRTPAAIAARLQTKLDLSDDQTRRVEEVFTRRMNAFEAIRQEMQPKFAAEHKTLHAEMNAILTPEQFERWATHFEAMRKRASRLWRRGERHRSRHHREGGGERPGHD